MYCLANLLFYGIPLLYYTNFNASINFCLSFSISISFSSISECNSFEEFCGDFEKLVILSDTLRPIESPVASSVF